MKEQQLAEQLLDDGLKALKLDPRHHAPLMQYLLLLKKWNQAYNLTAIRDLPSMVTRHVLDSLTIQPYVQGQRLLDVGSGAGLPGIPLAIMNPSLDVVLLDSNGKKTRFLGEVKRTLSLANVQIVQTRVENYETSSLFDTITSRAFSELQQFIQWSQHLIAPQGIWLAMKGHYPQSELNGIIDPYQIHTYSVHGLAEERCAVIVKNMTH